MNKPLIIRLETTADQHTKLCQLQAAFAAVCNALAPVAQRTVCWNRVALHHQAYRAMRLQFPALGSQMICNAVYSVSRACRLIYQHPQSPFNLQRMVGKPLPVLKFLANSPVYFDRHTLSLKDGLASMYTLDGRMRFNLPLAPEDEQRFRHGKLREIVLFERDGAFALSFLFADPNEAEPPQLTATAMTELPQYLVVHEPAPDVTTSAATPSAKALLHSVAEPKLQPEVERSLS